MDAPIELDIYYSDGAERSSVVGRYHAHTRRKTVFLFTSGALLLLMLLISASIGAIGISPANVLRILLSGDLEGPGRIVWSVRMPRIVGAILVGAALSLSGTVMQSVLRNPLASPYTLGLSNAAAFGAAFAIVVLSAGRADSSSIAINSPYVVTISAFAFSLTAAAAVLLLAKLTRISATAMVLAGIAIGSMFAAGLTLMQYLADSVQLANIVSWTFGDLGRADLRAISMVTIAAVPSAVFLLHHRWEFNAMDAGDETAKGLGVNTERLRVAGMVAASLLSAISVAFFGIIAFIGLLGPHIARRVIGGDHRRLMYASPLLGAIILLASDTAARSVLAPMVLPVGILTSMLGGPLFIYLLLRRRMQ